MGIGWEYEKEREYETLSTLNALLSAAGLIKSGSPGVHIQLLAAVCLFINMCKSICGGLSNIKSSI